MVKILEKGEVPESKPMRCRCDHCQTLFEFTATEAVFVADQRDGNAYTINCPTCSRPCWVAVPRTQERRF